MADRRRAEERPRIAISTIGLRSVAAVEALQADYRSLFAREALFELSYEWDDLSLAGAPSLRDSVVAAHAPCPRSAWFPNLASRDPTVRRRSLADVRRTAQTAAEFGARLVVLHPGYSLDAAVPIDPTQRLATMARHAGDEARYIWLRQGNICVPGYCETPAYRQHRQEAVAGLAAAARLCAAEGVELAVENLNPRITYLFQLPTELVALVRQVPELRICVDLGHLWIASLVHRFDFYGGLRDLLATGRVASAHVHDNESQVGPGVPSALAAGPPRGSRFSDDHLAVGKGTVPIARAVQALKREHVDYAVIESLDPPLESARRLESMLVRAGTGRM